MAASSVSQSGIYGILHVASGRIYVGSAVNIARRWYRHRSELRSGRHYSLYLLNAWKKHGEAAFSFVILEVVVDTAALVARESHWIEAHRSYLPKRGFNLTRAAASHVGIKRSADTRKRMSLAQKGRVITAEARERIRVAKTGKRQSAEAIANSAAAHVGLKRSPETKARMRAAQLGTKASSETRAKLSKMRLGKPCSPRVDGSPLKGKKRSEAFRKKVSQGIKAHWEKRRLRPHQVELSVTSP